MYKYISDLYYSIFGTEYPDNNINSKIDKSNSFYYLSLFNESKDINNPKFSIHGLWPQYNKTTYPSYCRDIIFNVDELKPIISDLNTYWYSNMEKNQDFWEHEYKKHGSCMFTKMTELQYFQKALDLYYQAKSQGLPVKFYNSDTHKCLIPVSLEFEFIKPDDVTVSI